MHSKASCALGIGSLLALGCTGLTIDEPAQDADCSTAGNVPLALVGSKSAKSSCSAIQGDFWTADDGHSTIAMSASSTGVCVTGQIAQVVNKDFTTYWGAAIGVNLNQPPGKMAAAYDAVAHGIEGFGATLSGSNVPASTRMRLQLLDQTSQNFCVSGLGPGATGHDLGDFKKDCFNATPGAAPSGANLTSLGVTITAQEAASLPFNLCVDFFAVASGEGG